MGKRGRITLRILAGLLVGLFVFLYAQNNWIQVSRFEMKVKGLPNSFDGLKVVHVSDLHGKEFGDGGRQLAGIIEKQEPDVIFCSGDMLDSQNGRISPALDLISRLSEKYPVYCSLGNHEQIISVNNPVVYKDYVDSFRKTGAQLLDNNTVVLSREGGKIAIHGFTSELYHYSGSNSANWEGSELTAAFIQDALGSPADDGVDILLGHNPKWLDAYAQWGADVVFAGHVHGGVIRIPLKGGLLSPDVSWFPPYDAGLYRHGDTAMHVSRGLGNSVIPFRVFNRPDVSVITLKIQD